MLFTSSWLIDIILVLATAIFLLHKYISRSYNYWKKRGIFYIKPMPFFGNSYDLIALKSTIGNWQNNIYNSTDEPYFGIFMLHKPILVLKSPELIKEVLMRDFNKFPNRAILAPDHNQILSNALFFSKNSDWRLIRSKVSPALTSGKLKAMFSSVKDIGYEMNRYIKNKQGQLESKELSSKFSTEVIARIAFGVKAHCFEEEDCYWRKIGKTFFEVNLRNSIIQSAYLFTQSLANFLKLELVDRSALDYLKNVLWDNIKQREKANIKGNDIIDMVIELRKNKEFCEKHKFEGDKLIAQPIQFFAAGIETTSQTTSFTLYELCINPQIQNKVRQEILNHLKEQKDLTYDGLKDMKYLEMCILETLRKYPVLPFLDRECIADWTIPGTDIVIDKEATVYIPVVSLHYDEKYFPEPDKYDPERFMDISAYNQNGLYYLPFGEGPRICIGERLAMMNVKVALISILSHFEIVPTSATPIPLKLTKGFISESEVGLPMRYVEL